MKPPIIIFTILIFSAIISLTSCVDSGLEVSRSIPDPRILNTDETGRILRGDRSDWCGTYDMTFGPVYPNPAHTIVEGSYAVPQRSFVNIYFRDTTGFETVIVRNTMEPGYYHAQVNVTPYMRQQRLLKLYIKIGDSIDCSGDVQFY